jgi:predicted MFS family arabinose efflux permease
VTPNRLLWVLGLTGFAANISIRIVDPIVPLLAREFNTAVAVTALLASAYTLPYALGQPILGPLGDAKGKARVMFICALVMAGALFASMFAWSVASLAVCRAIAGLSAGACIPLSLAMIGDRFPIEQRQLALSRYLLAVIFGQIVGTPMAGLLSELIGWRWVFGIAGIVALAAAIAIRITISPLPGAERKPFTAATIRANYAVILANPLAKFCYLAVAAEGAFIYGFLPYVAALLESRGAGGIKEAGFVVAGIGLGGLLFSLALPRMLKSLSRTTVMRAGGVVIAVSMMAVGLSPTWPLELMSFTFVGLGFYMLHTGIQTEVTELAPEVRGSAVALHAFSLFFGMALGPLFYGVMLPITGPFMAVSAGGFIVLLAAFLVAAKVHRPL